MQRGSANFAVGSRGGEVQLATKRSRAPWREMTCFEDASTLCNEIRTTVRQDSNAHETLMEGGVVMEDAKVKEFGLHRDMLFGIEEEAEGGGEESKGHLA